MARRTRIGHKISDETKKKIGIANSIALKGKKQSQETVEKRRKSLLGHKCSEETKRKIGKANKGKVPWIKGKKAPWAKNSPQVFKKGYVHTEKILKKISLTKKDVPWSESRRKAQELRKGKPYNRPHKKIKTKPVMRNGREYHPMWNEIRKLVYKLDKWICQECGQKCGRKNGIACHHIDYDITNNDFSNLITLCTSCHSKTNFKREDWIIRYKNRSLEIQ